MAFLEDNANIILRDGTSQDDRISTALSESFVLPDERGIEDLLFFIYNLASQINYTSPEYILDPSKENINWQIFFEKKSAISAREN